MNRKLICDVILGVGALFVAVYLFDLAMGYDEYGVYLGDARIWLVVFGAISLLVLWVWMLILYFKAPSATFSIAWLVVLIVLFYVGGIIFYLAKGRKRLSVT